MELEKELKVLLSEEEYNKIKKAFDWEEEYDQINVYYTPVDPMAFHATVRIRSKKNVMMLEVKIRRKKKEKEELGEAAKAVKVHEEYAKPISSLPYEISGEELTALTGREGFVTARITGVLATRRSICHPYAGHEVALDESNYLGTTDHELEVEYTDSFSPALFEKLKSLNIDMSTKPMGKIGRFNERLGKLR